MTLAEELAAGFGFKSHKCHDCGKEGASFISAGYVTPLPDVAPTHYEWQEYWLCGECAVDSHKSA